MAQLLREPQLGDDPDRLAELAARVEQATSGLLTLSARASIDLPGGLSLAQLRALATAERLGPCAQGALAESLGISTSSASRLVDRLVAVGVLDRRPSEVNRREVTLRVTSAGGRLLRKHEASRQALFADVLRRMRPADIRALLRGLDAVKRLVERG